MNLYAFCYGYTIDVHRGCSGDRVPGVIGCQRLPGLWFAFAVSVALVLRSVVSLAKHRSVWPRSHLALFLRCPTWRSTSNMALNLAPFSRWTLRDKATQRRFALRWAS
jgi:hypothetical protein